MKSDTKNIQAERFVNAYNNYNDFYEDFVETFKLSTSQCIALSHLCELAEHYGAKLAAIKADNIPMGELFEIYRNEDYKEA